MTESQLLCRLCVEKCKDYESLYDENGFGNELYEITFKYFHPTILNMDKWKDLSGICLECCRHIWDFHNFQKSTFVAQLKLTEDNKHVVIKTEGAPVQASAGEVFGDLSILKVEGDFVSLSELAAMEADNDTPHQTHVVRTRSKVRKCEAAPVDEALKPSAGVKIEKDCLVLPEIELIDVHEEEEYNEDSSEDELPTTSGGGVKPPKASLDQDSVVVVLSDDSDHEEADAAMTGSRFSWDDEYEIPDFGRSNNNTFDSNDVSSDEFYAAQSDTSIRTKSTRRERNEQLDDLMAKWMPTINCALCSGTVNSWPALQEHFRLQHTLEQCYIPCCGRKLKEHWTLKEHLRYHNDPSIFKCKICGRCHTTKCTLKRHMDAQHPDRQQIKSVCKICDKGFTTKSGLKYHCTTVHDNFSQPERMVSADGSILYHCKDCGKTFTKYAAGRQHIWYNHRFKSRYRCTICGNSYRRPRQYREHVAAHTGKHLYACAYCPTRFTYFNSLQSHRKNKHPTKTDDKFYKTIDDDDQA